jgi:hypothetical protein
MGVPCHSGARVTCQSLLVYFPARKVYVDQMPQHPTRFLSNFDECDEYIEELHRVGTKIVVLRGQGWQRRNEMHEAISELAALMGIDPCETK